MFMNVGGQREESIEEEKRGTVGYFCYTSTQKKSTITFGDREESLVSEPLSKRSLI